ncbi:MAG: hypothetical protein IPM92_17410 [Saprospiraceae bacterium]|nr:hypothetical protein [Saprospiraceae bacterium]
MINLYGSELNSVDVSTCDFKEMSWNTESLASGIYFIRITGKAQQIIQRIEIIH